MAGWEEIDRYLRSQGVRIGRPTPGQTTGGNHTRTSWHFRGQARDYGTVGSDCEAVYQALVPHARSGVLVELFWQNRAWKNGARIGAVPNHWDHVHAALTPGRSLPASAGPQEDEMTPAQQAFFDKLIRDVAADNRKHMEEIREQLKRYIDEKLAGR